MKFEIGKTYVFPASGRKVTIAGEIDSKVHGRTFVGEEEHSGRLCYMGMAPICVTGWKEVVADVPNVDDLRILLCDVQAFIARVIHEGPKAMALCTRIDKTSDALADCVILPKRVYARAMGLLGDVCEAAEKNRHSGIATIPWELKKEIFSFLLDENKAADANRTLINDKE